MYPYLLLLVVSVARKVSSQKFVPFRESKTAWDYDVVHMQTCNNRPREVLWAGATANGPWAVLVGAFLPVHAQTGSVGGRSP